MDEKDLVDLITDNETGLLNATYFELRLDEEFKKSWRYQWTYSLVVIEAVGLETIERKEGRAAADALVLDIAGEILTASRDVDLSARLGRHRFGMLLPGTPATGACTMIQRVMSEVLQQCGERISLSVGLTEAPQAGLTSVDEFTTRAESALALAQSQGTNQVVTWNAKS